MNGLLVFEQLSKEMVVRLEDRAPVRLSEEVSTIISVVSGKLG